MSEKPTVIEALSAVMGDVQSVRKADRNTQQNFNFRGIDAVVNAVGPALRKHGVVVVPVFTSWESERYATKSGAQMRGITLTVTFRFYGPAGDFIDGQATGESSDSGDKAMPKAHSVAYRTLLLQALCIPTDEPDPDSESHERAPEKKPRATRTPGDASLITSAQRNELFAKVRDLHISTSRAQAIIKEAAGTSESEKIPAAKFQAVMEALDGATKVAA